MSLSQLTLHDDFKGNNTLQEYSLVREQQGRKINQNLSPLKVGLAGDPFFSSDKNLACQLTEVTEIFSSVVFSSAGEV